MRNGNRTLAIGAIGAIGALVTAGAALGASTTPAPAKLSNPTKTCAQLTARFQRYLGPGQDAKLAKFVSPAFVIERNDGTTGSWPTYLKDHPVFTGWNISIELARYSQPVLVCVATTSTTQLVNGAPVVSTPTENLSTYAWQRGAWRITSYARFNS